MAVGGSIHLRGRRRAVALSALALAVPAIALGGSSEPAGPAQLNVVTTLKGCGIGNTQIFCALNVSFDTLPDAASYTASLTRADGSVVDYGAIPAGGAPLTVPYVGPGTYSVRISAYGAPATDGGGEPAEGELIATDEGAAAPDGSGDGADKRRGSAGAGAKGEASSTGVSATQPADGDGGGSNAGAQTAEPCEPGPTTPAPADLPKLPDEPPADLDPDNPDEDDDGVADADEAIAYQKALIERWAAKVAADALQPQAITCPTASG